MRIDLYLWGILVAGFVMFVGLSLFSSFHSDYGIPNTDEALFEGTYGDLAKVATEQKSLQSNIIGDQTSEEDTENSMFKGGYTALKAIFSSTNIVGNMTQKVATRTAFGDDGGFNVVKTFTGTIMIGLGVMFLFGIIAYLFRFQPRN